MFIVFIDKYSRMEGCKNVFLFGFGFSVVCQKLKKEIDDQKTDNHYQMNRFFVNSSLDTSLNFKFVKITIIQLISVDLS